MNTSTFSTNGTVESPPTIVNGTTPGSELQLFTHLCIHDIKLLIPLAIVRISLRRSWWALDSEAIRAFLPLSLVRGAHLLTHYMIGVDAVSLGGSILYIPCIIVLSYLILGTRFTRRRLLISFAITSAYTLSLLFPLWNINRTYERLGVSRFGWLAALINPFLQCLEAVLIKRCLQLVDNSVIDVLWYCNVMEFFWMLVMAMCSSKDQGLHDLIENGTLGKTIMKMFHPLPILFLLIRPALIKYTSPMMYMVISELVSRTRIMRMAYSHGWLLNRIAVSLYVVTLVISVSFLYDNYRESRIRENAAPRAPEYIALESVPEQAAGL